MAVAVTHRSLPAQPGLGHVVNHSPKRCADKLPRGTSPESYDDVATNIHQHNFSGGAGGDVAGVAMCPGCLLLQRSVMELAGRLEAVENVVLRLAEELDDVAQQHHHQQQHNYGEQQQQATGVKRRGVVGRSTPPPPPSSTSGRYIRAVRRNNSGGNYKSVGVGAQKKWGVVAGEQEPQQPSGRSISIHPSLLPSQRVDEEEEGDATVAATAGHSEDREVELEEIIRIDSEDVAVRGPDVELGDANKSAAKPKQQNSSQQKRLEKARKHFVFGAGKKDSTTKTAQQQPQQKQNLLQKTPSKSKKIEANNSSLTKNPIAAQTPGKKGVNLSVLQHQRKVRGNLLQLDRAKVLRRGGVNTPSSSKDNNFFDREIGRDQAAASSLRRHQQRAAIDCDDLSPIAPAGDRTTLSGGMPSPPVVHQSKQQQQSSPAPPPPPLGFKAARIVISEQRSLSNKSPHMDLSD